MVIARELTKKSFIFNHNPVDGGPVVHPVLAGSSPGSYLVLFCFLFGVFSVGDPH